MSVTQVVRDSTVVEHAKVAAQQKRRMFIIQLEVNAYDETSSKLRPGLTRILEGIEEAGWRLELITPSETVSPRPPACSSSVRTSPRRARGTSRPRPGSPPPPAAPSAGPVRAAAALPAVPDGCSAAGPVRGLRPGLRTAPAAVPRLRPAAVPGIRAAAAGIRPAARLRAAVPGLRTAAGLVTEPVRERRARTDTVRALFYVRFRAPTASHVGQCVIPMHSPGACLGHAFGCVTQPGAKRRHVRHVCREAEEIPCDLWNLPQNYFEHAPSYAKLIPAAAANLFCTSER